MKITSFQKLLESEMKFNELLKRCKIPITNQDEIHRAYSLISDFDKIGTDPSKSRQFITSRGKNGAIQFALFDLSLISYLIPHIYHEDSLIMRKKVIKILKISTFLDESVENNEARNTLFELLLFSYLKSVGIYVELREPSPDIFVKIKDRNYFIQCKRVFSLDEKAIRSNLLRALEQLTIDLKDQESNSYGIVALSIERRFTEGNKILNALTEDNALEELRNNLRSDAERYSRFWQDPTIIPDKKFIAVLLHHLTFTNIRKQSLPATGHFILLNNTTFPVTKEFRQCAKDFSPLYSAMDS